MIIIINGSGGVGKFTFVKLCKQHWKIESLCVNISSIEPIKVLAARCGWTGAKTEKDRKFLSDLKKLTTEYNNFSFVKTVKEVRAFISDAARYDFSEKDTLIFIDCREPEEIDKLKAELKAKTLLITSKRVLPITTNTSDKNVLNYEYDYYIDNSNTLESLERKALSFLRLIKRD